MSCQRLARNELIGASESGAGGVGRMARVDLTVPAGVAAGDPLEFEHDGTLYNAAVPDGLGEGDVFQIEVSTAHPAGSFTDYLESRAASGDLMDRFVAWFDSHGIEEQFETFLAEHAHLVKGAAGGSGGGQPSPSCSGLRALAAGFPVRGHKELHHGRVDRIEEIAALLDEE